MRSLRPLATIAGLLLSMGAMPAFCAQNRIVRTISNEGPRVPLADSVAPRALRATDLGPVPANTALTSLTLRFSMTAAQSAALDQLMADQGNPKSPRYRQWLTPETYAAQFGLSSADIARVTDWLQGQGFTVNGVARSHSFVTLSGTAAQVEHAFGTSLHLLSANGEQHIGNLSNPVLPAALTGVVNGITGLDDFRLKPRLHTAIVAGPKPEFTSATSGNHFLAPGDFATIYGLTPLLSSSTNGAGVTIAIIGQTDVSLADVAAFRAASGLSANVPMVRLFGTDPGTVSADVDEAALDLEWSGAAAPGASLLFVNGVDVINDSLTQAIDQNLAPILSISYGLCEAGYGDASLAFYNQLLRQANSFGQTVVAAGGDSGATDCDFASSSAVNGLAVTFPASSPYVTGIGGTQFNLAGGSYFGTTNDASSGSALGYIPETVWNESVAGSTLSSGGGGVSSYFTKPSYQTGAGVPNDFSRDVPDLAFDSAFGSLNVPYLFCSKGFCTNGYRNAGGLLDTVGGTSVPTPAFAGILALLEQKLQAKGGLGNVNPVLYSLANSTYASSVFHDVTTGDNASPCTVGTADCPSGDAIGYGAGTGYDLASGLGSVNVFNMVSDWNLVTPASSTGPTGTLGSLTTLVSTPASVTAGTAVSIAATVTKADQLTNYTIVATGTVQLLVDNVAVGSAVQLVNGAATLPVATTGLGSGAHTIAATYSGDTNFAGSKGISTIDVVATTLPDFALTASTGQLTVASGATASGVTFTVTPVNGFTGSVAFSTTNLTTLLAATSTFSVNPVAISSSAVGTTVFTLTASIPVVAPTPLKAQGRADAWRWSLAGSGVALAGGLLLLVPRRRRRMGALVCAVLATGIIGLSGCSSGASFKPIPVPVQTFTNATPGTYTVFVSATSTNTAGVTVTHRSAINLVVQ